MADPAPARPRGRPYLAGLALLAGGAVGVSILVVSLLGSSPQGEAPLSHPVARGDLVVTLYEEGSVQAKQSIEIRSEVEQACRVLSIVAEGTAVQKGDLLVHLDDAEIRRNLTNQQIACENARSLSIGAHRALEILEMDLALRGLRAEQALAFARTDLQRYEEGESPQRERELRNQVTLAEEEVKRAADRLEWTKRLEAKGYVTRTERESDALALARQESGREKARAELDLLVRYDRPRRLQELKMRREETEKDLERVRLVSEQEGARAQADIQAKDAALALEEQKRTRLEEQVVKCKVRAPADGVVVYFSNTSRGRSNEGIAEGSTVNFRQPLLTLPNLDVLQVVVQVHESRIDDVRPGQEALARIDAFRGLRLSGRVEGVAVAAENSSRWWSEDTPRRYPVEITLTEKTDRAIKPGMSAKVEIQVARVARALSVPIQCVVQDEKGPACWRLSGGRSSKVPVRTGRSSLTHVEILEGLAEGDRVLLAPPTAEEGSPRKGQRPRS